jgi:hypothetical protein
VTPGQDRGHAGGTTARERVEHAATSWHVDVQKVGHQLHRLRRRVPLRIANLWNLKNVRLMPEYWIGREHRGGNAPQRVRRVGCVAVEISPEHSPLGGVEGVGTAGLLAVTVATPGDACRIQVRYELRPWHTGDDDWRAGDAGLIGSTTPPPGEDPIIETQIDQPGGLHHLDELAYNPIVHDQNQPATGFQHATAFPKELGRRSHIPRTHSHSVGRVRDDCIEARGRHGGQHLDGVALNQLDMPPLTLRRSRCRFPRAAPTSHGALPGGRPPLLATAGLSRPDRHYSHRRRRLVRCYYCHLPSYRRHHPHQTAAGGPPALDAEAFSDAHPADESDIDQSSPTCP